MYYINTLLTRRSRLDSRFKKKSQCHSFILPNRVSEISAANWRSQTREKLHLTCGDTFLFLFFFFFSSGNPSKTLQVLPCNKMLGKKKKEGKNTFVKGFLVCMLSLGPEDNGGIIISHVFSKFSQNCPCCKVTQAILKNFENTSEINL